MLIGAIAQQSGFSRDTIRYYEKIGLVRLPKKSRRQNNYKEYSASSLARLRAINQLKTIGYTLAETRQLVDTYKTGGLDCIVGKDQVLEKARLIDQQISQLRIVKQQLLEAVADCPDHCKINAILHDTLSSQYLNTALQGAQSY